jgi:tetratricopeptide (TPR) repeat protein
MTTKSDVHFLKDMFHEGTWHHKYQKELIKPLRENDWQKAIDISEKYIKGNEWDFYPYSMMSSFYYQLKKYAESIDFGKRALSYDQNCMTAIKYITLSNNKLGNIKEAYLFSNQYLELYVENPLKNHKIAALIYKSFEFIVNILSFLPRYKKFKGKSKEIVYQEFNEMNNFYNWSLKYISWCKTNYSEIIKNI